MRWTSLALAVAVMWLDLPVAHGQSCQETDSSLVLTYSSSAPLFDVVEQQKHQVVAFRRRNTDQAYECSGTLIHDDPLDPVFPGAYVLTAAHCEELISSPTDFNALFSHYWVTDAGVIEVPVLEKLEVGLSHVHGYDYAILRIGAPPAGTTPAPIRTYVPQVFSSVATIAHPQLRTTSIASDPRPMMVSTGNVIRYSRGSGATEVFPAWSPDRFWVRAMTNQLAGSSGGGNFDREGSLFGINTTFPDGFQLPASEQVCGWGMGITPLATLAHVSPFIRQQSLPIQLKAKPSTTDNARISARCANATGLGHSCSRQSHSSSGFESLRNDGCSLDCPPGDAVVVRCEVLGSSQSSRVVDEIEYRGTSVVTVGAEWSWEGHYSTTNCGSSPYDCTRTIQLDPPAGPGGTPPRPLVVWCDFDSD